MPFRSKAQWRWAFATGQPFARRWAHETPGGKRRRFRALPAVVKHLRGRHDQSTHGRRTPRRLAMRLAYREARAGGASIEEARRAARDVSSVFQAKQRLANIDAQMSRVSEKQRRSLEAERKRLLEDIAKREARTPWARGIEMPPPTVAQARGESAEESRAKRYVALMDTPRILTAYGVPPSRARATGPLPPEGTPQRQILEFASRRANIKDEKWNVPATEKQRKYLNDLVMRARDMTDAGTPQRELADEILKNISNFTKWEASKLIDGFQLPLPLTTLSRDALVFAKDRIESKRQGKRQMEPPPGVALFAIPAFRTAVMHRLVAEGVVE